MPPLHHERRLVYRREKRLDPAAVAVFVNPSPARTRGCSSALAYLSYTHPPRQRDFDLPPASTVFASALCYSTLPETKPAFPYTHLIQ